MTQVQTTATGEVTEPATSDGPGPTGARSSFHETVSHLCADPAAVLRIMTTHDDRAQLRDVVQTATEHLQKKPLSVVSI
jgi:hypothetical protein